MSSRNKEGHGKIEVSTKETFNRQVLRSETTKK